MDSDRIKLEQFKIRLLSRPSFFYLDTSLYEFFVVNFENPSNRDTQRRLCAFLWRGLASFLPEFP